MWCSEAIDEKAELIVTHHPLPFKPLSRITADTITGSMLLELIRHGIAVYSAHTAFDSAADGINQMWAQLLGLTEIEPLVPWEDPTAEGDPEGVRRRNRFGAFRTTGQPRAAWAVDRPSRRQPSTLPPHDWSATPTAWFRRSRWPVAAAAAFCRQRRDMAATP